MKMAKDPAFLFYPGDYLRDTQCLSESVQVAYDRIMCEHMRNICISQQQLNFFTKRLSEDEKSELEMVLTKVEGGFQIAWVAESICKRKAYSSSRSENRKGKTKEDMINISDTYVEHMVNENENRIETGIEVRKESLRENQFQKPDQAEIYDFVLHKYPSANIQGALNFADKFWSHYENNGWKVGKNKMKNWKLAISSWSETLQKDLFPQQAKIGFSTQPEKKSARDAGMEALQRLMNQPD
jgi:hypothetical protein